MRILLINYHVFSYSGTSIVPFQLQGLCCKLIRPLLQTYKTFFTNESPLLQTYNAFFNHQQKYKILYNTLYII